jgi:predicted Ser/Thr protein kinase
MYEFTFTIVDGIAKIDRRDDLSYELNEEAELMAKAVIPKYTTQVVVDDIRIIRRDSNWAT